MTRTLIDTCEVVVTVDDAGTELAGASILIEDGAIDGSGTGAPPSTPDERIDGRGAVALPGLVNTHHHLYQTLTRAWSKDVGLFDGSSSSTRCGRAWTRSGNARRRAWGSRCSRSRDARRRPDHHYVHPDGAGDLLAVEIESARELGVRFHPCRGSMDLGERDGGLPPDRVVETTERALERSREAVERWHDPSPGSMLRVAIAPCSPFSVTERLMRESADLARALGVRLHTHLAETLDEERFCVERFGMRPLELMDDWGWLGPDVWFAHAVHLDEKDARRLAETGSAVASCPTSNLRLGAGVAPLRTYLEEGVTMGFGVDGPASNEASHLFGEDPSGDARLAGRRDRGSWTRAARSGSRPAAEPRCSAATTSARSRSASARTSRCSRSTESTTPGPPRTRSPAC